MANQNKIIRHFAVRSSSDQTETYDIGADASNISYLDTNVKDYLQGLSSSQGGGEGENNFDFTGEKILKSKKQQDVSSIEESDIDISNISSLITNSTYNNITGDPNRMGNAGDITILFKVVNGKLTVESNDGMLNPINLTTFNLTISYNYNSLQQKHFIIQSKTNSYYTEIIKATGETATWPFTLPSTNNLNITISISLPNDKNLFFIEHHNEEIVKVKTISQSCNINSANMSAPFVFDGQIVYETENNQSSLLNKQLLDLVYPIGSIYITTSYIHPKDIFGGSWNKILGRFLLSSGASESSGLNNPIYHTGEKGGSATVKLTPSESGIPSSFTYVKGISTTKISKKIGSNNAEVTGYKVVIDDTDKKTISKKSADNAHDNMPPYLVVNMWERTA